MPVFSVVLGLALLVVGGDALVRGAVRIARHFHVTPLLIGLTLVGFGTSTPELVASLEAAVAGSPGIAIGNVVGSNIANILLILGIAALIAPIAATPRAFYRDGTVLAAASVIGVAAIFGGTLERLTGAGFLVALAGYIAFTYWTERQRPDDAATVLHTAEADLAQPVPARLPVALLMAIFGLVATVVGARLLVGGAIESAAALGVSETVVGLTLVAVGTSLPELVTSVIASVRRHGDLALGNIVGSNIYNVLGILGATGLVHPIPVPAEVLAFDVWVMLAATALLIVFTVTGWRLTRGEGAVLLAGYAAYIWSLAPLSG